MLPTTVQFLIGMTASALTDRLTRKVILTSRAAHPHRVVAPGNREKRITFTADQRRRLAIKGKELTATERKA